MGFASIAGLSDDNPGVGLSATQGFHQSPGKEYGLIKVYFDNGQAVA
jgi:hypothetical protein